MTRVRTLFTIVLPSMIVGGLLFGSAFTRADDDPPAPSGSFAMPPMPPAPPAPPVPPWPPGSPGPKPGWKALPPLPPLPP
jgi:hypothetical protein